MAEMLCDTERFESFLWDYGISLPYPLHLGPVKEVGVHRSLARRTRTASEDEMHLMRTWGRSGGTLLMQLARAVRSEMTTTYIYAMVGGVDSAQTRVTALSITGDDSSILIAERPDGVFVASLPWATVGSTMVGLLPAATPLSMTPVAVRTDDFAEILHLHDQGASRRTVDRALGRLGMSPELFWWIQDAANQLTVNGFVGAARHDVHGRHLSELGIDFMAAEQGGLLRRIEGPRLSFESLTADAVIRALRDSAAGLGRYSR
ncbi:hypothetical protein KEM60_02901 [Austwickia sp. TVS 96-490-7B]|uniref:hypothetical protein n=1 Tax=Austwickia sp. TVS 96-490-7B TaxID=2830843 RepID=UPI001C55E6F8|nr:hypothetical protein [Austwickia sp. TVS 96-490-7B]MBW3086672.1 hypothetical protein [Austwickia sp. TVS 96-490-7B]